MSLVTLDEDGHILMPNTTRYAVIEIGCSDRDTLDEQFLPNHPKAFLVSFEPQLDKYAVLLARGTTRLFGKTKDRSVPLGHHHERGVVLPLAISPHGGSLDFHVHHVAGCSSLMHLNQKGAWWAPWCKTPLETRRVPSITLSDALALIPRNLPIALLKVDAQGVDDKLIRATPARLLRRIERITLEVRGSHCLPLYAGQEICENVVEYMRSVRFDNASACPQPGTSKHWWRRPNCERAMSFIRLSLIHI